MDYNYLYNIIEFYLKNESDTKRANLIISKENEKVYFKLGMSDNTYDKTKYYLPLNVVNNYIVNLLQMYKGNMMVIDEKYELKKENNTCHYFVKFKNSRSITFDNFSLLEINNIRNVIYNIKLNKEEIRVDLNDPNEIKMNYQPRLQETGYASFSSLFLLVLFVSDIIAVSLWIFVSIFK